MTFWTWIEIKSSCSHFQLNLSQIAHIFNLMQLNSTENWVNLTQLIKNSSLTSRKLNIEIFSTFALSFCIIFLIESHEEKTWRSFDRRSWWETWRVSESCLNDTINEDQSWQCLIFKNSYNWILRIQKKIDTKTSIYVMFKDCARLEWNMFVTWKEDNVEIVPRI